MEIATITALHFRSGSLYLTELSLFVLKIMLGSGSETCWTNRDNYGGTFVCQTWIWHLQKTCLDTEYYYLQQ